MQRPAPRPAPPIRRPPPGRIPVNGAPAPPSDAPLSRRLLSLVYESLLLAAVLMMGALPFVIAARGSDATAARPLFQLYLIVLVGIYFGWQWRHGGQTLPMKTWRLRLVTREGNGLTAGHALRRFVFAVAGAAACGAGFLWAFADPDRRFLHDRLAGTRIVMSDE